MASCTPLMASQGGELVVGREFDGEVLHKDEMGCELDTRRKRVEQQARAGDVLR